MWLWFQPPPIGSMPGFVGGLFEDVGGWGRRDDVGSCDGPSHETQTGSEEQRHRDVVGEILVQHASMFLGIGVGRARPLPAASLGVRTLPPNSQLASLAVSSTRLASLGCIKQRASLTAYLILEYLKRPAARPGST